MTAEFVLSELQSVGSPEKAAHLSRFFKTGPGQYGEGDRFLGVVVPQTRSIAKANKAMPLDELQRLLDSPWHEARLCALLVLVYRFQDKKTPEGKYIFEVPDDDPLEDYSFMESIAKFFGSDKNDKLYLTGFNRGPTLAQTKDGIKAQFNMGTVSQRASDQIMYSIPALPGSSGSAVVNHKGQLVAINYAGVSTTQSFNYGIRVKYLKSLMKNLASGMDDDDDF